MKRMSPGPSVVSSPTRSPGFSSTGPEEVRSCTPISRAISMASVVLPRPGRAEEEGVVERLAAPAGRVDRDLERGLHLLLADELVEPRGAKRRLGAGLLGQGVGGGDFEALGHGSRCGSGQPARAIQRTGRVARRRCWCFGRGR